MVGNWQCVRSTAFVYPTATLTDAQAKAYVAEGFETVTAACPVPIVMAGGKKLPELEALTMAYRAVQEGAAGVDMGRNIFQSDAPLAMLKAVNAVVHELMPPDQALELFETLRRESTAEPVTA